VIDHFSYCLSISKGFIVFVIFAEINSSETLMDIQYHL